MTVKTLQLFDTVVESPTMDNCGLDDCGQRDGVRQKADQYKIHAQWMLPPHPVKDNQAIKVMTVMAERDKAIQERDVALAEKKAAMAERDMAFLQRDAAYADRDAAIMERDNAIAALQYFRENGMTRNSSSCPPGGSVPHGAKHVHHHHNYPQLQQLHPQLANDAYNHSRETQITDTNSTSTAPQNATKLRKLKRPRKTTKVQHVQAQAPAPVPPRKKPRKTKKSCEGEDLNKQAMFVKPLNEWRGEMQGSATVRNRQDFKQPKEWKNQDLGLNQVIFDESTMPVPVCSCTGKYQPCYKWGNGGWQSACCTTTISMYPLPVMPNKRHARVGGRKMSGSVFTKLLSKLAAEGHDLSTPVDLKDHWAKHGTNKFITIK